MPEVTQATIDHRLDEVRFLHLLSAVTADYGILRIGRFEPGSARTYAGCYVLRLVHGEFITQLVVLEDDHHEGPRKWTFHDGHYFFACADDDTGLYAEAVADLATR